ncbi:hypothetical protein [[Phormidium] sp. ETS-05]|uniref:hypothetical protein n=1 Tax=[Phormidium] sp. ETS-05 TaxID=222819 RepID=UPI0018EF0EDA|nr:hypothetical protein [[Phormidium] sp. ETS-05]
MIIETRFHIFVPRYFVGYFPCVGGGCSLCKGEASRYQYLGKTDKPIAGMLRPYMDLCPYRRQIWVSGLPPCPESLSQRGI